MNRFMNVPLHGAMSLINAEKLLSWNRPIGLQSLGLCVFLVVSWFFMAALCNMASHYIFALCFLLSIFFCLLFSSPNLSRRRLDVYHTSRWCGCSANLECRSEICCARLAANAGPKKVAKNRHLCTIPQLCRAISSQLRHVSTIGKKLLSSNISSTCPHNMVNFGPERLRSFR